MGKYYDKLQVLTGQPAGRNELGDLIPASESWLDVSECRDEPAGAGKTIDIGNGKVITYTSNVFCPTTCPDVAENATVRVLCADGKVQVEGTCKRFKRYRNYVKVWV